MKNLFNILILLILPLGFAMGQDATGSSTPAGSAATAVSTTILKTTTASTQTGGGGTDGVVYVTKASANSGASAAQQGTNAVTVCKPAPVITATDGAPAAESTATTKGAVTTKPTEVSANNGKATVIAPVTVTGDNKIIQP